MAAETALGRVFSGNSPTGEGHVGHGALQVLEVGNEGQRKDVYDIADGNAKGEDKTDI